MKHYLNSNNRQKHQRKINHFMRQINKNIEKDELWRGRFVVRQDCAQWLPHEDSSCWDLYVVLKFIDKKTKKTWIGIHGSINSLCWGNAYKLWETMNTFITEICNVWEVDGREALKTDKTDYKKIIV